MRYFASGRAILWAVLGLIVGGGSLAADVSGEIDGYIRAEMAKRRIPGLALAVVQGRQVEKLSTYGLASVELSVLVEPTTVFNLASISKVFTSVAVMTLAEAGKLQLDDSIGKHLDHLPRNWQGVKIRQLLSHTSGLPDIVINSDVSLATVADTTQSALEVLRGRPLDFEPGTTWRYNQTNYLLLSMLIEKLSGQSFGQYCKSHLFAPFGIQSAVFADERKVVAHRASEYTILDLASEQVLDHVETLDYRASPMLDPAGGLNISIADFSRWLVALADGKLLSKQSLEELWTPTRLRDGSLVDNLKLSAPWRSYGLGWMLNPQGDHPQAGHMGGARTSLSVFPRDELAIVVLTNLQGDDPDSLVTAIAKRYLHAEAAATSAPMWLRRTSWQCASPCSRDIRLSGRDNSSSWSVRRRTFFWGIERGMKKINQLSAQCCGYTADKR